MKKKADLLQVGDKYEPLKLKITKGLNSQFLKALDSFHPRYKKNVHPGVLFCFASITQSPSFYLEGDVAAVGAKFEYEFINPPKIDDTLVFEWKVSEVYERRSRLYQICEVNIVTTDGTEIMKRKINNTFIGGEYLLKRVKWEKENGYRRAISISEFPEQGYEIVSQKKKLTLEKLQYYSGGIPGLGWPARNIHTDREISIRSGIGKPIASGMMYEAYLTDLLIDFCGEENWFHEGGASVIAIDMAGDGDTITPKCVIREKTKNGEPKKLKLWCENQFGNIIVVGNVIQNTQN